MNRLIAIRQRSFRHFFSACLAILCAGLDSRLGAEPFADPEFMIDTWEVEQGLPQNSANTIVQTADGCLWFGTFRGLVRFDGVHFTVFDRSNTPELPSMEIVMMHLDGSGRLWVSTPEGTASLKDGVWKSYRPGAGWTGTQARYFAEGDSGQLYATTFDGVILHLQDDGFKALPAPPADPTKGFFPHVDEQGILWIVSPEFIGKFADNRWQRIIPGDAWKTERILAPGSSRDRGLWILTDRRLRKYRSDKLVLDVPGPGATTGTWTVTEDSAGAVWFSMMDEGLYRFTPPTKKGDGDSGFQGVWRHWTTENGLSYNTVRFTFEDREKTLWIGTDGGGLQRFRPRAFRSWSLSKSLPGNRLTTICVNQQGQVHAGTHAQGVLTVAGERLDLFELPESIKMPSKSILSLLSDRMNRLWIGGARDGLHQIDGMTGRSFRPDQVPGLTINGLFEDSQGRIWIGHESGITCFEQGTFRNYPLPGNWQHPVVSCFAENEGTGTIWAGGFMPGLLRLENGAFRHVADFPILGEEEVETLLADRDGTLWIGTTNHGLGCLRDGNIFMFSRGLPARSVGSILDDGLGYLWLSTERGIVRAQRSALDSVINGRAQELSCQLFDKNDGLPTGECDIGNQPSAVKDAQGNLWFVTAKGIARIDPRSFRYNTQSPELYLEKVLVDGKVIFMNNAANPHAPEQRYQLAVPPGSKRVEIHYHGSNLSSPEKLRYRHMLEGLDKTWIESGNQPVAYLQDPKPGNYRFRARAANEHGIWNEAGITVDLEVQPLLWQTLWLQAILAICVLGLAGLLALRITRFWLRRQFGRLEEQKTLQREQARLASVLEATSDLVAFADRAANLIYLNRAGRRMLGLNECGDLQPCKITDFLPEWATKRVLEEGIPGAIRERIWRGETALAGDKGQEVPLSQVIAVHCAADGSVEFLSTIARDISDRKRLEQQFAHSQRIEAIGRLAGGVAHDFNNLLTAILGYSDMILARLQPGDFMRSELEEIYNAAERAAALTRQLLAFSRKQTLKPVVVDLNEVVTSTERMLRRLIGEDITLATQLQTELWPIKADRGQLEQVIMNLALNARDAMPEGGNLSIGTTNYEPPSNGKPNQSLGTTSDLGLGSWVILTIRDNGCGMDDATLSRLFEPYFTTKTLGKGTGLGLATVYGIIKQSGGHVSVTSAPGKGTTFRIWLPPCNEPLTDSSRPQRELPAPQGKETVLVVEDDEFVRSLTCRLLESHGHNVLQARDAEEAMSLSRSYQNAIHLLLTDVIMPGQTGPELAGRLVHERPSTKVLFMSGYPNRPGNEREHVNGDGLLMKPFTAGVLLQKVREALNNGHAEFSPKWQEP